MAQHSDELGVVFNLCGAINHKGTRVRARTLVKEGTPITAFATADEEDDVVLGSEFADMGDAVGYLAADGVVVGEGGLGRDVALDEIDHLTETVEGLGGLAVEGDVALEVKAAGFLRSLNDDGCACRLSHEAEDFGVAALAEDDNLLAVVGVGVVLAFDAFLQMEDNGTGGINEVAVVALGLQVGGGWLAVGTQKNVGIPKLCEGVVVNCHKPGLAQALYLATVVHDVAEAVEGLSFLQFLLCFANGARHAEAEAGL